MNILHQYINGNVHVKLYEDGTKERDYTGVANPIYPESIDVKITNYCDAGCAYCHEKSTKAGQHGDLDVLFNTLKTLPAGKEVSLGGGNPLSHPDLTAFLQRLKEHGIVTSITINQKHIGAYQDLILKLISEKLVYGVGISYSDKKYLDDIAVILKATNNVVFHTIMGINPVTDIDVLKDFCERNNADCKVLVLGYKQFGFGIKYYIKNKEIEHNKYGWYTHLAKHFKTNVTLSFDNLAISQLNLKRYFTGDAWKSFYMGDDFVFTMYIDGVNQTYAPASTSEDRVSFSEMSLVDFFKRRNV